jgi:hypothetical protein
MISSAAGGVDRFHAFSKPHFSRLPHIGRKWKTNDCPFDAAALAALLGRRPCRRPGSAESSISYFLVHWRVHAPSGASIVGAVCRESVSASSNLALLPPTLPTDDSKQKAAPSITPANRDIQSTLSYIRSS